MQILSLDNKTFYLNDLPDEIEDDLRFAILDNSDHNNPDYFYKLNGTKPYKVKNYRRRY